MEEFKYKVSVIVPVYNVEKYLRDCLDSLLAQDMEPDELEVLLIDDGSIDNSLEICKEYAEVFPIFKVFSQENSGVSSARNLGLEKVQGKYIFFLDSDDMLARKSIKNIVDVFDKNYEDSDILTYPISKYDIRGKKTPYHHYRFDILKENKTYSTKEFIYICQTTMNICVKHEAIGDIRFDENLKVHEDQKFINQVIARKEKITFCKDAEYKYLVRDDSAMSHNSSSIELFEPTMNYYENLFQEAQEVPKYIQAMYIHDLNWKLRDNVLFPYHYEEKEFSEAIGRISALLSKVDMDIILKHPNMDKFHKYFFLSLRDSKVTPFIKENDIRLLCEGKNILNEKSIEVIVRRIKIINGKLRIYGSIKSPVFTFIEKPELLAIIDDEMEKIELSVSGSSWYKSKTRTNTFWAFTFEHDVEKMHTLSFKVKMDGIQISTRYWFGTQSPFNSSVKLEEYIIDDYQIKFCNNKFIFSKVSEEDRSIINCDIEKKFGREITIKRKKYMHKKGKRRIWLYYDNFTVEYDNAYLQFIHDFEKDDGIEKFYIYEKDYEEVKHLFNTKHEKNIVRFGSEVHKELYLNSEKIFTAFIEHFSITPFKANEEKYYVDLFNAEIYYLQHGVLHACIPWYYTAEMVEADKVIVSSYFEIDNMTRKCGYKKDDLVTSGMTRYDQIDMDKRAKNKIIFAPSWRDYLIGTFNDSGARRETCEVKVLESNYYKNIVAFVSDSRLHNVLEKYDLYLDLKLHPNFYSSYRHLLNFNSDRINLAKNKVDLTEYNIFITDFSSFVFDYAYLKRPIIYFVPDYIEFKAGMNRYRELYLPFEKAFGKLVTESEEAVNEVVNIIKNGFKPEKVYKERMESFYLPMGNCAENLYNYVKQEDSN